MRKTYKFNVAGINKRKTAYCWDDGRNPAISVIREPDNAYDRNAISFRVGNRVIGYVPRGLAQTIAPLLDKGMKAYVKSVRTELVPKRTRKQYDDEYYYDEDWTKAFRVVTVRMLVSDQKEETSLKPKQESDRLETAKQKKTSAKVPKPDESRPTLPLDEYGARAASDALSSTLSPRLKEAFFYMVQGKKRSEIAILMGISDETMREYAKKVYAKLGIHSKSLLIDYARRISLPVPPLFTD